MLCIAFRDVEKDGKPVAEGKEKYLLCRSDKATKNRHVLRNHPEKIIDQHGNYEFIVDSQHKEAQRLHDRIKEFARTKCVSKPSAKPKVAISLPHQIPVDVLEEEEPGSDNASRNLQKSEDEVTEIQDRKATSRLERKVDDLTVAMEKINLQIKQKVASKNVLGPLLAVGQKNFEDALPLIDQWSNVTNIREAVNLFPTIRLYPSQMEDQIAVLRCDTCFRYLTKDPYSNMEQHKQAETIARKGIGR